MRFFHRLLLIGVLSVVRRPRITLLLAGIALAVCAGVAALTLKLSSEQNKLFDPNVKFFQDYLHFTQNFPENEAMYVVIEPAAGQSPALRRWTGLADAIVQRLQKMPRYVKDVEAKVPLEKLGTQGLLFDTPANVQKHFQDIKRFIPLVKLWAEKPGILTAFLGSTPIERFITALQTQPPDSQTAQFVGMLADSWDQTLQHPGEPVAQFVPDLEQVGAEDPSALGYFYVPDESDPSRHLLLVRVYERTDYAYLTAISETVDAIRTAVKETAQAYPEFKVGLSGRPALEADEMRTTDRDSNRAEIVALIAVFIGLVVFLRSFWLALAGEIALCVGIGWTFGWASVSVGELNLLSIVFLLALIGIGMDYLVQILTRYRQEVARRSHPRTIWISVFYHVSAPINTACLGAAGAFAVSIFTHFRGAAQLGVIAGGGLLLCLLAGYVVLPAMLTILPLKVKRGDELPDLGPPARVGWNNFVTPVIWIALLLAGIPLMLRTRFDPGLLRMQAPNLESVQLVHKLQTWSAVIVSKDLDTLRRARDAVEASPQVGSTESILQAYDNLAWLRQHQSELPTVNWTEPNPLKPSDLSGVATKAHGLAQHLKSFSETADALNSFGSILMAPQSPQTIASRLSDWQREFITRLKKTIAPFHPADLDIQKLPPELRTHYVGIDGSFALHIYPRQDLWNQQNLKQFVTDLDQRVASVKGPFTLTGIAINIYHSTASIERSFHLATIYALCLIFVLVLLDLRRLGQTLAAISVLAFGLPMLLAAMGFFGQDWNFANFFGLPILIGAGHEYGVFLVHRYREARHDPRRVWRRWDVSDRALLLCAYVTCSSFGFFWALAHHRGLKSLGLVMALGIGCIYLAAVLVLRPLLIWKLARRQAKAAQRAAEESAGSASPQPGDHGKMV